MKSPFLSSPAAIPSLFLKVKPLNSIDSEESVYGKSRPIRFSLYKKV